MAAGCVGAAGGKIENDLTKAERDALVCGGPFRGGHARGVMPLCRKLAREWVRRVERERGRVRAFDVDDLEGDALAAAVEAARYFQPDRGIRFTSFVGRYIDKALLKATDERRVPAVRCWPTQTVDDRTEAFDPPEPDENEPDDLDHFEYLTADQRAAFDLVPAGPMKDVLLLVVRGFTVHQIEGQTGMPHKDVRLAMRNAVNVLRRAGLVPAGADPYPDMAAQEAAAWEEQKGRNLDAARRRDERERRAAAHRAKEERRERDAAARRELKAEQQRMRAALADQLRPLLADRPRAKSKELAAAIGRPDLADEVAAVVGLFKLRPPRSASVPAADAVAVGQPEAVAGGP